MMGYDDAIVHYDDMDMLRVDEMLHYNSVIVWKVDEDLRKGRD